MNVEQTLTEELAIVGNGVAAPPPPAAAALVAEAERLRTRTRTRIVITTVVAAAAAVAAVVLGSQVGRESSAPQPTEPAPSYYAPGVPYVQDGGLYVDHERQGGDWVRSESAGDYTIALASDGAGVILRGDVAITHLDGPLHALDLSPDGTKAAWIRPTGPQAGVLVVRDLVDAREIGRLSLLLPATGDQGPDVSAWIDDSGIVHYRIDARGWTWEPGHDPAAEQYVDQNVPPATGFAEANGRADLSPDHLWGAWMTDHDGNLTDTGPFTGLTVQKPGDPGSRFTIPLPDPVDSGFVLWRSPTRLSYGSEYQLCDIVERWCKDYSKTDTP